MRHNTELSSDQIPLNPINNSTLCYYKANRYPPYHPQKYQLTPDFWYEIGMRLVCVIIFEVKKKISNDLSNLIYNFKHVILLANGIIAYFIPTVPSSVRETLHYNRTKELEVKLKAQSDSAKTMRRRIPNLKIERNESQIRS